MSLAGGAKHGHALLKDIEAFAGARLGPGALYGAITRLEERGLIEPLESDDRRRPYRITAAGSEALADSVDQMRELVRVGQARIEDGSDAPPEAGVTRASGPGEPGARAVEGIDDQRLRWYPRQWRARYGDELAALLDEEYGDHLPVSARFGLVTGGLRQRAQASGLGGDSVPAPERVRSGALVVLAAWVAFVVAGANFAKFSEHFDEALPHTMATHRVPDLAFLVIQTTAGMASILVVAGALLALPAFVRFLRADGWPLLRRHLLRALGATALTVAVTVPLLAWAHRLTSQERNGGVHWYGALYLMWGVLIVLTLTLWTVVAIAAARRLHLSKRCSPRNRCLPWLSLSQWWS